MTDNNEQPRDSRLSSSVTVSQYRNWIAEGEQRKIDIINFIKERFTERYIVPFQDSGTKHGFGMMAVNCLMIEALECFWQGLEDTKKPGKGLEVFESFFNRYEDFKDFRDYAISFYEDVRCGILHQAETKGGWHIIRIDELFKPNTKTINATKFQSKLIHSLELYGEALLEAEWDEEEGLWDKFRTKMDIVCKNCILDTTQISRLISVSPDQVYHALIDENSVAIWMTPDDMTSNVEEFNPSVNGRFRVTLTYKALGKIGKTSANTDTYHGKFDRLIPNEQVIQTMEFVTEDAEIKGKMRVTFNLTEADNGTKIYVFHDNLPSGISPNENKADWQMTLNRLAALVEGQN